MAEEETTDDKVEDQKAEEVDDKGGEEKPTEKSAEELRRELREGDRVRKRESDKAKKRIADLEKKLQTREDEDKSEQEKAIEKARKEAREEALTEAEKERRSDRLEVAVTRAAAKTFADTDDALLHIQRRITSGDIASDEIFDDEGKVKTDTLKSSLEQLLEDKPHLGASDGRPSGSADAGRGRGGGTSAEEMSTDDHLKAIRRHK